MSLMIITDNTTIDVYGRYNYVVLTEPTYTVDVTSGIFIKPVYTGATVFIPSAEQQIAHTSDTAVETDIIIEPIPSNWGLITWDGTVITVS